MSPQRLETRFQRLSAAPNVFQLVAAEDGLYWHDGSALYGLPEGADKPALLYALPGAASRATTPLQTESRPVITGLLVDADHVYWSEASDPGSFDSAFFDRLMGPARVLSMPRAGGDVRVLADLPDRSAIALALDDTRVILKMNGRDAGYQGLDKRGGDPIPLAAPAIFETSRVVGDQIYWTEPFVDHPLLYRAHFDATEPEAITRIESGDYDVGPGYVLWRHDRTVTEPELLLKQNFMIWREGGCVQPLPGNGESISYGTARDARYVYWHGFNALGAVSETPDGVSSPSEVALLRLDLQSGAIARLETPGFHSILGIRSSAAMRATSISPQRTAWSA